MKSVGFKEWSAVCDAVGQGRQTVLIRKGGIAEGREGFSFKHSEFFLFPTWFHEQVEKVRDATFVSGDQSSNDAIVSVFVEIESSSVVTSWETANALAPLHILRPDVVRERFDYDDAPGLHVAFVRAYRLAQPWKFPNEKRFGGCRSWVELPPVPAEVQLEPVLSDAEHEMRRRMFDAILHCSGAL